MFNARLSLADKSTRKYSDFLLVAIAKARLNSLTSA
jgi:hypothetical protein